MLFLRENNSAVPALEDLLKKVKNVKPHLDINGSLSKAKMWVIHNCGQSVSFLSLSVFLLTLYFNSR